MSRKTASKYVNDPRWRLGRGPWDDAQVAKAQTWRATHYPRETATAGRQQAPDTFPRIASDSAGEAAVARALDEVGDEALGVEDLRDTLRRITNPERRAKVEVLIERAAKLRFENALAAGGYLKREDVERARVERVQAVRQEMSNIRLLAIRLEGKSLAEREQALEDWARGVCRKFERGGDDNT